MSPIQICAVIEAVRNNQPIDNQRLEYLNQFTRELLRRKGMISQRRLEDFFRRRIYPRPSPGGDRRHRRPSALTPLRDLSGADGGLYGRQPLDKTAYAHREANFIMKVHARWETQEEDARCIAWTRKSFENAKPPCRGGRLCQLHDPGRDQVGTPGLWQQLCATCRYQKI